MDKGLTEAVDVLGGWLNQLVAMLVATLTLPFDLLSALL